MKGILRWILSFFLRLFPFSRPEDRLQIDEADQSEGGSEAEDQSADQRSAAARSRLGQGRSRPQTVAQEKAAHQGGGGRDDQTQRFHQK